MHTLIQVYRRCGALCYRTIDKLITVASLTGEKVTNAARGTRRTPWESAVRADTGGPER